LKAGRSQAGFLSTAVSLRYGVARVVNEPEAFTDDELDRMIAGAALLDDPDVLDAFLRCRECGEALGDRRLDARFCSSRCRLRAWRKGRRAA
jgi:hypothetical protein